jgi:hypothetical protein
MGTIWNTVGRFFGPSQNERFAELLLQLADASLACAAHFRATGGQATTVRSSWACSP